MNECDIAETCTGDSSQVCPAQPPCGARGEATPIFIIQAVWSDSYSPCLSTLLLASLPDDQPEFPHLRQGLFMPPGFAPSIIGPYL